MVSMIKFNFLLTNPDNFVLKGNIEEYRAKYPEILNVCGKFEIIIDNKLFFSEPQFPVVEFIYFLDLWLKFKNKKKEMYYNSVEIENNPLISFISKNNKWVIHSIWQKYECDIYFTRKELETSIFELKYSVNQQLKENKTKL